jgi:RNA polymerase sigma-70 factor (ECF subfamily)
VSRAAAPESVESLLEQHRAELTGYCYRMLGSPVDAEDAVQETLLRAWRSYDRFEGRSSLKSWLYRIAANVCFDMLGSRQRRARPMDLTGPGAVDGPLATLPESAWIEPVPDGLVVSADADPAEQAVAKESLRLAFIAALQHLPPRQRAVLILREALRWEASEVAELLDTTVASVNSALQRARAALEARDVGSAEAGGPLSEEQEELLARYVDAFQDYDMESLTSLVHEDATQTMPPFTLWLRGRDDIFNFWLGPGAGCRGSRLIPVAANGLPAWGQYRPDPSGDGSYEPWAVMVVRLDEGGIAELTFFLETERLFPLFGLPPRLDP